MTTSRRGICEGCSEKSTCAFDNALGKAKPEMITVLNPIDAEPGDSVEFDLTGHNELKISMVVWVIPLIGLIVGAFSGSAISRIFALPTDPVTLGGLVLGFLIAFVIVMIYERYIATEKEVLPSIIKKVNPTDCRVTDQK